MILRLLVLAVMVALLSGCATGRAGRDRDAVEETLDYAQGQYRRSAVALDPEDGYPRAIQPDGRWKTVPPSDWTSGFYPGVLWHLHEYGGDDRALDSARRWTAGLEGQKLDTSTHDVGFQIMCSFGNGYRLTGDEHYKQVILRAAQSLATRYSADVGAIQSWSWNPKPPQWRFPVIIDNMMNLELLFWASKHGGEQAWYDMAVQHALTTRQHHVREDGSTYHVVDFDPETGERVRGLTWQGHSDESAWARGQAWGLYGFTVAYRETGDDRFLVTAKQLADFYIDNLPDDDPVPFWDFHAPNIPDEERDASAAAIAASGLLELSTHVSTQGERTRYRGAAERLIDKLASSAYLTTGQDSDAVLAHSVGSRPHGQEVDVSIIYADYYFVEALLRQRALD